MFFIKIMNMFIKGGEDVNDKDNFKKSKRI